MRRQLLGILMAIIIGGSLSLAQDDQPGPDEAQGAEQTQPGVARVSLIDGQVSIQRGDTGEWEAITVNAPLVAGDYIATGPNSRVEVELNYANILRLDGNSEARLADLTPGSIQVQLASGLADFVVLRGGDLNAEIDTPNMAVHPEAEGTYRIEVDSDSETSATVRRGSAEVSTPQGSTDVREGEMVLVRGTDNPEYKIEQAANRDGFDAWNSERDSAIRDAQSWQYTNQYYTGAEDLDRYGHWENVPGYDYCWTPNEGSGWVPYRDGNWTWEPYYGWTWVSYEPWGWAPYHYGRWFFYGGNWVWWPGPTYPAYVPLWSPAYVSFLFFGGGGFGFGFNSIGWVPIGPYDPFFPWYGFGHGGFGSSFNVINVTNITNVINVRNFTHFNGIRRPRGVSMVPPLASGGRPVMSNLQNVLSNSHITHAVTTLPGADFGRPGMRGRARPVSVSSLRNAQMALGGLPVAPTAASTRLVDRPAPVRAIPRGATQARFFSNRQAPTVARSFNTQADSIRQMVRDNRPREITGAELVGTRALGPAAGSRGSAGSVAAAQARGAAAPAASRGWTRFGAPPAANSGRGAGAAWAGTRVSTPRGSFETRPELPGRPAPRRPLVTRSAPPTAAPAPGERDGWQRFNGPGRTETSPRAQRPYPSSPFAGGRPESPGWGQFNPGPEGNRAQPAAPRQSFPSARYPSGFERPAPSAAPQRESRPPLVFNPPMLERIPADRGGVRAPAPRGESRGWFSGGGARSSGSGGGARSGGSGGGRSSGGSHASGGPHRR